MPKLFTKATGAAALAIVVAGGVAALAIEAPLAGAQQQQSQGQTLNLRYACRLPGGANTAADLVLTGVVPKSVAPGSGFSVGSVQGTVTLPHSLATSLFNLGHDSLSGTVTTFDFSVKGAAPSLVNMAPITFGPVSLLALQKQPEQPLTFTAPGLPESLGPFTAGRHGVITITPSVLDLQLPTGTLSCSGPRSLSDHLATGWRVSISSASPVPVSTVGGIGLAVLAGGFLYWHQRRKQKAVAVMASAGSKQ